MQAWTAWPRDTVPGGETEIKETMRFDGDVLMDWGVDVLLGTGVDAASPIPINYDAGGSVNWSYRIPDRVTGNDKSDAAVRRTATLTVTGDTVGINFYANQFRIWTRFLSRYGNWIKWYNGVFVTTDPGINDDGMTISRTLQLADKSYLWSNQRKEESEYFDIGTNVLTQVRTELTSIFGETIFNIPTDITAVLEEPLIVEGDTPYAERWRRLLEAKGYDAVYPDELGIPTVRSLATLATIDPEETYGPTNLDSSYKRIVIPGSREPLLPSTPNVVRFVARQGPTLPVEGNGFRTKKNQSTGPASIDERGYEVFQRVDIDATDQATLDAVANADAQRYFAGGGIRFRGQIAVDPRLGDQEVVQIVHPRMGLSGAALCAEWVLPLQRLSSPEAALMSITTENRVVVSDA